MKLLTMCPVEFARRCFWLSDFTTKRSRSMSWQNNNRDHQTQTWRHGRLNIRRLATKHPHKCNRLPKQVKHHDWIEATNTDMAKQFSGKRNVIRSRLKKSNVHSAHLQSQPKNTSRPTSTKPEWTKHIQSILKVFHRFPFLIEFMCHATTFTFETLRVAST